MLMLEVVVAVVVLEVVVVVVVMVVLEVVVVMAAEAVKTGDGAVGGGSDGDGRNGRFVRRPNE